MEVVVAAGQQIPGLQFLSWEPLCHLIIHDALYSSTSKIEDVRHLKLRGWVQVSVATTPPDLLYLLLQGGGLLSNDSLSKPQTACQQISPLMNMHTFRWTKQTGHLTIWVRFVQGVILFFCSPLYPKCGPLERKNKKNLITNLRVRVRNAPQRCKKVSLATSCHY